MKPRTIGNLTNPHSYADRERDRDRGAPIYSDLYNKNSANTYHNANQKRYLTPEEKSIYDSIDQLNRSNQY